MSATEATAIATDNGEITLEQEARESVLRALLIGLSAFGELEKLRNVWEMQRIGNRDLPDDLRPIDVSGSADEVANFAEAIRSIGRY